ncbi:MAG: hypothetical protein KAI66_08950 [Lentisphaeria bacterium]|nr:hypothetical protein [Lentisphaeria bacterium]
MRIDVNCSLGRWPFARFEQNTPEALRAHLAAEGIAQALVWPLEAALFPDPHVCSLELATALRDMDSLHAVPVIDPTLSNWEECLSACGEQACVRAARVLPNYHRYTLADESVHELARKLVASKSVLMIQMRVEDERNQYPLMKIPGVSVDDVLSLTVAFPELSILCLCPYLGEARRLVAESTSVCIGTSFCESANSLHLLLGSMPAERLLFGSHTPVLYTRANSMKLDCAEISDEDRARISHGNARRLFFSRPSERLG